VHTVCAADVPVLERPEHPFAAEGVTTAEDPIGLHCNRPLGGECGTEGRSERERLREAQADRPW